MLSCLQVVEYRWVFDAIVHGFGGISWNRACPCGVFFLGALVCNSLGLVLMSKLISRAEYLSLQLS